MIDTVDIGNVDGFFVQAVYKDGELIGRNMRLLLEDEPS